MSRTIRVDIVRDDRDALIVTGVYPGSSLRTAPCACVHQAYYEAVKSRPATGDRVAIFDRHGNPVSEPPACQVDPDGWTWSYHQHTHVNVDIVDPAPEGAAR